MNLIKHIFAARPLSAEHEAALKSIHWHINNDSDYVDLETEITYLQNNTDSWDYSSFNVAATFDLENNALYFIAGNNIGDGLNSKFEFSFDCPETILGNFDRAVDACEDAGFVALMQEYPTQVSDLRNRVLSLVTLITKDEGET